MSLRDSEAKTDRDAPKPRKHHTKVEGTIMRSTHPDDSTSAWIKSDNIIEF